MKSQASRAWAWERRKSAQVVDARRGRWMNAFLLEDLPDCGRRDLDAESGELTIGVAPSHQVAVPAQDGVRTDDKPQPAQNLTRQ
ncbi:hypothetical protein ACIBQ6_44085 [Nonomuraea sp. NPDC049655]|uniref:hypothetical protein n=1 Tax=Nonomuraea sp. NPDC049655 TaxID=3364355 RepID=UPI00379F9CBE